MVIVEAPARGRPELAKFQAARKSGTGFTPGCCPKYLSSNRTVASINDGEISRSGVQIRYFWSAGERDAENVAISIAHTCGKIDAVDQWTASEGRAK